MKRDIFNGKIKPEAHSYTLFSLILAGSVFLLCGITFLIIALTDNVSDHSAIITLYILSGISCFLAIFYPLITIIFVRKYPKYSKFTKLLLKSYVFYDLKDNDNK